MNGRIETTLPKAKELRRIADKLITLGKKNTLHARRQALALLQPINREVDQATDKRSAVHKLFVELAPRYVERAGGYTRVVRGRKEPIGKRMNGKRPGDNAQMAVIEFVEEQSAAKKPAKKKRAVKRAQATTEAATTEATS